VIDFHTCGFCNRRYDDICEVNLWHEYDPADLPTDQYVVVCRSNECQQKLEDHPMLFTEVPWSAGGPGKFILVCRNCPHRKDFTCTNPNLRTNGGPGLEVKFTNPLGGMIVCSDSGCHRPQPVAYSCEGNPK
jgi:hypothetical protein